MIKVIADVMTSAYLREPCSPEDGCDPVVTVSKQVKRVHSLLQVTVPPRATSPAPTYEFSILVRDSNDAHDLACRSAHGVLTGEVHMARKLSGHNCVQLDMTRSLNIDPYVAVGRRTTSTQEHENATGY